MDLFKLILLSTVIAILGACGGGGGSSDNSDEDDEQEQVEAPNSENNAFLPNRIAVDRNFDGIEDSVVTREWVTDEENFYIGREERDFNADGVIDYIETEEAGVLVDTRRLDENADGVWDEVTTIEYEVTLIDQRPSREVTVDSSGVILEEINYTYSNDGLTETRLIRQGGSSDIDREVTQTNAEGKIVLELTDFSNDGILDGEIMTNYVVDGNVETITSTTFDFDPVLGRWISNVTVQVNDFNDTYNNIDITGSRYEINATGTAVVLSSVVSVSYRFDQYGNINELSNDINGDGLFENLTVFDNELNANGLSSLARYDDGADDNYEGSISRTYQEVDLTGLINGSNFNIRPQDLIITENLDPTSFIPVF